MPELPEVETLVRQIAPHVVGRTLRNPRLLKSDVLRGVSARRLLADLRNRQVAEVTRRAKHVVIRLTTGQRLVIQPRMTGTLLVYDRRLRAAERRYVVLKVGLGGGESLVYRDVRRLGTISLLNESAWRRYTARIGPEPLSDGFTPTQFFQSLRRTTQAVKKAIMDQGRLAGVGNIYANEALFLAGIDPSRRADRLTRTEAEDLLARIRQVLGAAVEAGGTTVRDYRSARDEPGSYQHALRVYGREGEPCVRCGTRLFTTHLIDGRATTVCWRCQNSRSVG